MEQEVVEFCKSYLPVNREAFCDSRLDLVINDARFLFPILILLINLHIFIIIVITIVINYSNRVSQNYSCGDIKGLS